MRRRPSALLGLLAALAIAALAAGDHWLMRESAAPLFLPDQAQESALTNSQGQEIGAALTLDGSQTAYSARDDTNSPWQIFTQRIQTTQRLQITHGTADDLAPTWSPDGKSIAFLRRASLMSDCELMLVSALGGPVSKLLDLDCRDLIGLRLHWSPDATAIAFAARSDSAGPFRIGLFELEPQRVEWLTSPPAELIGDTQPVFSPDGSALAFVRREGYGSGWNVYTLSLGGNARSAGPARQITHFERMATAPAWTPDANSLFFLGEQGAGREGIWSIAAKPGAEPKLVWRSEGALLDDIWHASLSVARDSGGDTLIAYSFGARRDADIYRADLSGPRRGEMSPLIATSARDGYATYSPNGRQIAFHTGDPVREIWLADADGERQRQATRLGAPIIGPPAWSPDGRSIVFHSRRIGAAKLYHLDVESLQTKPLTSGRADDVLPAWSRDARHIYFPSNRSGDWAVWRMPAAGGEPQALFDGWAPTVAESFDGDWLYFSDSKTGDFYRQSLRGSASRPERIAKAASKEIRAFHLGRTSLYFVQRGAVEPVRGTAIEAAPGVLNRLDLEDGSVERLFEVQGYLSSVAPDESHVLLVHGPVQAIDLRLLRIGGVGGRPK